MFGPEGSTPSPSPTCVQPGRAVSARRDRAGDGGGADRYLRLLRTHADRQGLRATAVNRLGARLVGMGINQAGKLSFMAAGHRRAVRHPDCALHHVIYYESGFLIALKGFVGAPSSAASYPLAALGAVSVGLIESFSSFWASAFKEVIVFTVIIPVLLWRSLTSHHVDEA
jgi:branched-chain amino acid transport system permease protein